MVEDAVTDPKRIAQLLSSELTGLERGVLSRVSVVDADPDAEPSSDGTLAYRIALDGDAVGRVVLRESSVAVVLTGAVDSTAESLATGAFDADAIDTDALDADGLTVRDGEDGIELRVTTGAAVKRAVDTVVDVLEH